MRRLILGILAVVFLAAGAVGLWQYGTDDSGASAAASVAVRAGALLGALWLALPQLESLFRRFPPWMLGMLAGCALMVVVRPRMLVYVLPLIGILLVLRFFGWLLQPLPMKPKKGANESQVHRDSGSGRGSGG